MPQETKYYFAKVIIIYVIRKLDTEKTEFLVNGEKSGACFIPYMEK